MLFSRILHGSPVVCINRALHTTDQNEKEPHTIREVHPMLKCESCQVVARSKAGEFTRKVRIIRPSLGHHHLHASHQDAGPLGGCGIIGRMGAACCDRHDGGDENRSGTSFQCTATRCRRPGNLRFLILGGTIRHDFQLRSRVSVQFSVDNLLKVTDKFQKKSAESSKMNKPGKISPLRCTSVSFLGGVIESRSATRSSVCATLPGGGVPRRSTSSKDARGSHRVNWCTRTISLLGFRPSAVGKKKNSQCASVRFSGFGRPRCD